MQRPSEVDIPFTKLGPKAYALEVVGDPGVQDMDLVCRAHQVVEDGSLDEV